MVLVAPYSLWSRCCLFGTHGSQHSGLCFVIIKNIYLRDFPGGLVVMDPRFHYRGFDPWSGN